MTATNGSGVAGPDDARTQYLSQFLTRLKRASSTCEFTIDDLERVLDHCLLCRAPANHLGLGVPPASLRGELDAQRVVVGLAPCAAGQSPAVVYAICEQCAALPEWAERVVDHVLGPPGMRRGAA